MKKKRIYKVIFINEGKLYEIFAQQVFQGDLYGFVEVEELLFGEKSSVVVDPAEERLKTEFSDVKRTYIPMHSIIRIDEVEKQGTAKISLLSEKGASVMPFPSTIYSPGSDSGKSK